MVNNRQKNKAIDVSVIVTLHGEGILAYKTLRSLQIMTTRANARDIKTEILIGLDNADKITARFADEFAQADKNTTVYRLSLGDLGLHRNELIKQSKGKYVLIHDGDDFFTQNFIVEAFAQAEKSNNKTILIPQALINFDAMHYMTLFIPSDSKRISKRFFFEHNYYTSQYLVPRTLFDEVMYDAATDGFGYEDWHLNVSALALEYEFHIVPNTAFFYRRKKTGSLLTQANTQSVLLRKNKLFEPNNFITLAPRKIVPEVVVVEIPFKERLRIKFRKHILTHRYLKTFWTLHKLSAIELNERFLLRHLRSRRPQVRSTAPDIAKIVAYNARHVPKRMAEMGLKQELIHEWGILNSVEPLIRSSWDMFEYIPITEYPVDSGFSNAYYDFCKKFKDKQIDDIIFVPHMVRGGAELATIHLTKTLTSMGRKVLVVSSLDSDSVWGSMISEIDGAYFVENKKLLIHVPDDDMRMHFWMRVIQYWNITRATTINAEFGYKLLNKYRKQLAAMGVYGYVHTYAFDITEDGYLFNYIPNGLTDLYGAVRHYVTDSGHYARMIEEINGFSSEEVRTLYLPVNTKQLTPKKDYTRKNKVIYAARICNQKIADIAVEVGRLLGEQGIELHFYGNIDPEYAENDRFLNMISSIPSVKYMGTFDSFGLLPLDDYDMYLLTTRTEGLANVIIEACVSNIYIVSVAVGGLPECIENHENGYLLPDTLEKFNPQAYCNAIMAAYESNKFADKKAIDKKARKVQERHSQDTYSANVKQIYDL